MSDMLYMWADYLNSLTLDDLLRDFEIEVAASNLALREISYMWADYLNSLTLDGLLRDFEIEVAVSNLALREISTYDTPAFDIRLNNEIVLFCAVLDGATPYPSALRSMNRLDEHRLYEMIDISIFEDWFRIHAL